MSRYDSTADYTLSPAGLHDVLVAMTAIRQPVMVWGPPGCAKSDIARSVAHTTGRAYFDVRALLRNPVDLVGLPVPDHDTRQTRWYAPDFLPSDPDERSLVNLEELVSAKPMVQAALYQLVLDRRLGEYILPEGASIIACGNRASDRGVVHRMPTPLASRFVHVEVKVDVDDWLAWAACNDIAPEVQFYIQMRPDRLHDFDPTSDEASFSCPRTWEFASNIVKRANGFDSDVERSVFKGTLGEASAVEFVGFLRIWRELPHPQAVLADPANAIIPENTSALLALLGSLYRVADDSNFDAVVTYSKRLRRELGAFLVGQCVRTTPTLQHSRAFIEWAAHTH